MALRKTLLWLTCASLTGALQSKRGVQSKTTEKGGVTTNERIKKLRKALDLTQSEFASRIGSVQNTITGYETGRRIPSNQVLSLICREFNVNEEWLRTGDGDMFLPGPRDELDEMVTRYGLPKEFRTLAEKFLSLKPDARQVVLDYMQDVAAALTAESAAADQQPAVDQHAIWEAEARAEAEEYYQEILEEKRRQGSGSASFDFSGGGDKLA